MTKKEDMTPQAVRARAKHYRELVLQTDNPITRESLLRSAEALEKLARLEEARLKAPEADPGKKVFIDRVAVANKGRNGKSP
jgi:hypothetical protein